MAQNYRELDVALSNSEMKQLQNYTRDVKNLGLVWDDLSRSVVMPFVGLLAEGAVKMQQLFNTSISEQIESNIRHQANAIKRIARLKDDLDTFSDDPKDRNADEEKIFKRKMRSYMAQSAFLKGLKDERKALDNPNGLGDISTNLGTSRDEIKNKFGKGNEDSGSGDNAGASKLLTLQNQNVAYLAQLDSQFATELGRLELQRQARDAKIHGLVLSEQQIKAAGFENMQSLQATYLEHSNQLYIEDTEKQIARDAAEEQRKYAQIERILQFDLTDEEREFVAAERRQLIINNALKGREDMEHAFRQASLKNWAEYDRKIAKAQRDKAKIDIQEKADLFGGLSGLAEVFAGKQSKIHKAMFLAQKAYVLQGVLLENKGTIAKAWNSAPFPANLGVVGMALAKTGVLKAAVTAIQPPAYHTGGIIGEQPNLRPDEFSMIGLRGEEVLTQTDPRHRNNLGRNNNGGGLTVVIHNNANPVGEASGYIDEQGKAQIFLEADEQAAAGIANQNSQLYSALESAGAINPADTAY
jgi:hypothetical protein